MDGSTRHCGLLSAIRRVRDAAKCAPWATAPNMSKGPEFIVTVEFDLHIEIYQIALFAFVICQLIASFVGSCTPKSLYGFSSDPRKGRERSFVAKKGKRSQLVYTFNILRIIRDILIFGWAPRSDGYDDRCMPHYIQVNQDFKETLFSMYDETHCGDICMDKFNKVNVPFRARRIEILVPSFTLTKDTLYAKMRKKGPVGAEDVFLSPKNCTSHDIPEPRIHACPAKRPSRKRRQIWQKASFLTDDDTFSRLRNRETEMLLIQRARNN
ncbi:hypothetical protein KIN20_003630 [Parelaphostrongylus tenuis]|uniref:Uncharacterized protein n=1 Tax=Parelaphostrongylus tenuis TaxID=148309 RepID=A0AAD5MQ64_PARTN|nr:hypothetical protein KIN20_003630 [Parelaphostrongylus tenuis]